MLQIRSGIDDAAQHIGEVGSRTPSLKIPQRVPAKVVRKIFKGKPLPFQVNDDGSVDAGVYLEWLAESGNSALKIFEESSMIVKPFLKKTPRREIYPVNNTIHL